MPVSRKRGLRVEIQGLGVCNLKSVAGFWVWGLCLFFLGGGEAICVWGLGSGIWGLGFRMWGMGCGARC
jgi:hypothetical protein